MVFFKNSELYKVIQESKKVLGQVISINTKDLTAYSVNIHKVYQIEKLISWNTYDILALKEVDLKIEY